MELRSIVAKSQQGPFLQVNEDTYDFDLTHKLYMLFDGFGGSNIGDIAVREVKEKIKKIYTSLSGDGNATMPFFYSPRNLLEANALINAVQTAHTELYKSNLEKPVPMRAGASMVAMAQSDNILNIISVGNCKILLIRKGHYLELVSPDNLSLLSDYDLNNPFVTIPMNALGLYPDLVYTHKELRVIPGDVVTVLTDGVYARLELEEIFHTLTNVNDSSLKLKAEELMDLANQKGNMDNQSIMILEF